MNDEYQSMAANAIAFAAQQCQNSFLEMTWEHSRPSVVFKPTLSKDGNQWCALLGDNLAVGLAGFGDSPADAFAAFDKAFHSKS